MRISTNMIYDAGVNGINQQLALQLKLQQQVAAGRNLLTPSDDPVAASQALQVQQLQDVNSQYGSNIGAAQSALGLEDTQLSSATDLYGRLNELVIQATSSASSATSRNAIAVELRARFTQMLGIANAKDGTGQYMFSGYKGSTQPFTGSVDGLLANPAGDITYQGDDGQRTLEISPSNQLAISDSGTEVFMRIPTGNGYFTTTYSTNAVTGLPNSGTGVISTGTVTDPAAWNSTPNKPLTVTFSDATHYDVVDSTGATLSPGNAYTANQPLALPAGISVSISGSPAAGDQFTIQDSSSQSVFKTIANLIGALESTDTTDAGNARYQMDVANVLADLGQASGNNSRVRSAVGSRAAAATSQQTANTDLNLQYAQRLSVLEGSQQSDQTKTISDLTLVQTQLQAAQKSFVAVSGLSLFNYI